MPRDPPRLDYRPHTRTREGTSHVPPGDELPDLGPQGRGGSRRAVGGAGRAAGGLPPGGRTGGSGGSDACGGSGRRGGGAGASPSAGRDGRRPSVSSPGARVVVTCASCSLDVALV